MQTFDIYFVGETLPDADPGAVRRGVAKLFKVQETAVDSLFSGKPLRMKQGLDAETASRYRAAFREVGALIQIVPAGDPPPPQRQPPQTTTAAPARPTPASSTDMAGAGDLGVASGAISAAEVAEVGEILDHTPPPPPAQIDTGSLEALPPNTGSLEDCKVEKAPTPIPDISHLKLVDD